MDNLYAQYYNRCYVIGNHKNQKFKFKLIKKSTQLLCYNSSEEIGWND